MCVVVVVDDDDKEEDAVAAVVVIAATVDVFCCCYFLGWGLLKQKDRRQTQTHALSLSLEYYSGMFYLLPAVLPSRFLPSWFQCHYSSECFKHIKMV